MYSRILLKIQETTLLERMVQNCIINGIQDYIIVVGHKKEKVFEEIEYLKQKYGIKIDTVENKKYDQTNTSFSVYLATKSLENDVMIINGDNVIDANIISGLKRLEKTALVVDNHKELNHESFKLKIELYFVPEFFESYFRGCLVDYHIIYKFYCMAIH